MVFKQQALCKTHRQLKKKFRNIKYHETPALPYLSITAG